MRPWKMSLLICYANACMWVGERLLLASNWFCMHSRDVLERVAAALPPEERARLGRGKRG